MNQKKRTRIYALIKNRKVFIGRCSAIKLSSVIFSHCRGEKKQTQGHFDLNRKRPDLYVFEELEDEDHITYRHWLAWIHTFEVAGYDVLNNEDTLENSRDLHPKTRQIFEQIQIIPLELHLELAYRSKYTASDYDRKHAESNQTAKTQANPYAATEVLSTRMSKAEVNLITSFARCMNLTVRDAVIHAINNLMRCDEASMDAEQKMYSVRQRYLHDVEKLKKKNASLYEQLENQRRQHSEKLEKNRKRLSSIQSGVDKYLTYLKPDTAIPLHIEESYYGDYMHSTEIYYEFPRSEGFAVIRPHAILQGSTPQLRFLVGETDHGENIKLRYYPSKYFIGMFPGDDRFGLRGSCWLVGWEQKEDNVMQLNFSLPLSVQQKYENPMAVGTELGKLMWEIDQEN